MEGRNSQLVGAFVGNERGPDLEQQTVVVGKRNPFDASGKEKMGAGCIVTGPRRRSGSIWVGVSALEGSGVLTRPQILGEAAVRGVGLGKDENSPSRNTPRLPVIGSEPQYCGRLLQFC